MKRIFLKNVRKYTLVDDCDYALVQEHTWWSGSNAYAVTKIISNGKRVELALHRLILGSNPNGLFTDHINRNRLDNRRANLRFVTWGQNVANCSTNRRNTTGYKGVHYHKHNARFVAYIGKNPRIHIGCFSTAKEAALAYNKAAIARYGVHAGLNKIKKQSETKSLHVLC